MDEAEFDKHALAYEDQLRENIAITGEDPTFFAEYKIELFSKWAHPKPRAIVDFGSGIGNSIPYFRKHFAESEITCADVSLKSLAHGSRRFPGREQSLVITQEGIPAPDQSFDAAFSACVFHHIPHEEHGFWLKELFRVVRPGGSYGDLRAQPLQSFDGLCCEHLPVRRKRPPYQGQQPASEMPRCGLASLEDQLPYFFPTICRWPKRCRAPHCVVAHRGAIFGFR